LSYPQPLSSSRDQTEIHRIVPAGDEAIVVELGASISREVNKSIRDLETALIQAGWPEIVATVPSYRSLLVYFDPVSVSFDELAQRIRTLSQHRAAANQRVRRWTLPVCYGGDYGPDLNDLATKLGLSADEIIRTHSTAEYMVYLIGFSPGFAYLGELPKTLEVPRKTIPAPLVAPNTIQIGGQQTAISSMPMPSGWYIVGRTPLKMYQPANPKPFLLEGGDLIRFEPIVPSEFDSICAKVECGTFEARWEWAP
jgi:KipI family sensor histidine kinase inhibitor